MCFGSTGSGARREEAALARQQAATMAEQTAWWRAMGKPLEEKMYGIVSKPLEEQSYFKRMMGDVSKRYAGMRAQAGRLMGSRLQYGGGGYGAVGEGLGLAETTARAGAWGTGEEMRRQGMLQMIGVGRGGLGQGLAAGQQAGQLWSDISAQEAGLAKAKAAGVTQGFSSGMSAGSSCICRIFEATGELTPNVRAYRDVHYRDMSHPVGKGYKKMADLIVPLMLRYSLVKDIMYYTMAWPLDKYASWWAGDNEYGWLFFPFKVFWTGLWRLMGRR